MCSGSRSSTCDASDSALSRLQTAGALPVSTAFERFKHSSAISLYRKRRQHCRLFQLEWLTNSGAVDHLTARRPGHLPTQQEGWAVRKWQAARKETKTRDEMLVITVISASVDSQKVIDNDIDEIANKASPKMHP